MIFMFVHPEHSGLAKHKSPNIKEFCVLWMEILQMILSSKNRRSDQIRRQIFSMRFIKFLLYKFCFIKLCQVFLRPISIQAVFCMLNGV